MKFLKTISVLMKALSYKSALNFKCQNHFLTSDCRFLPWYFFQLIIIVIIIIIIIIVIIIVLLVLSC